MLFEKGSYKETLFEKGGSYKEQNRTIELAAIFAVPVMGTGLRCQTDARQPRASCEMLAQGHSTALSVQQATCDFCIRDTFRVNPTFPIFLLPCSFQ